jgi:hypothetical protein
MLSVSVNTGTVDKTLARYRGTDILGAAWGRLQKPLMDTFSTYPPQTRKPQPFKTARQRKYFFWALRTGKIQVPYRRKDKVKKGWRSRIDLRGSDVSLVAWNIDPAAEGLMGRNQWGYHRGNWWQAHVILRKYQPIATKYVDEETRRRA